MIKKFIPALIFAFIVFLGLAFFGDFKKTGQLIISFNWLLFPVAILLSSLNFVFRFFRWQYLLSKISIKIDKKNSLLIFLSGLAMTLTPLRGGELVKSAMIKKVTGDKISHSASVIFVERLTDAIAMLFLMSVGLFIFNYGAILFFLSSAFIIFFIVVINHEKTSLKIIAVISKIGFVHPHSEKIKNLYSSSKTLLSYNSLLPILALSVFAWSFTVLDGALIFYLLGVKLSLFIIFAFAFIFCFSGALGFLTAVPGGLGVSDVSVTGLLILLLHLSKSISVTGILIMRLSTLWFGTVIGIIAMLIFYRKPTKF